MNRFHRAGLCFVIGLCFFHSTSFAQLSSGPEGSVPKAIRIKPSLSAEDKAAVAKAITGDIAGLTGGDAEAQKKARTSLIQNVLPDGGGTPSADYLDTYANLINQAIMPLTSDAKMSLRLNAAIVTANVADHSDNGRLAPAARKFLNDKSDPVALWGMKATRSLLPAIFRNPMALNDNAQGLLPEIVPAVKSHMSIGAIVDQAYHALTLDIEPNGNIDPKVAKMLVPAILELLTFRVDSYANGVPPEPQAENRVASFVANAKVWSEMSDPQKKETVQLLANLLNATAQRAAADKKDLDAVMLTYKSTAGSLYVIGGIINNEALKAAAMPAGQISPRADGAEILKRVGPILTAIHTAFPDVQLPGTKPTTAPTSNSISEAAK